MEKEKVPLTNISEYDMISQWDFALSEQKEKRDERESDCYIRTE